MQVRIATAFGLLTLVAFPAFGQITGMTSASSRINDRPISTVSESWNSTELKVTVFSKTTDPRNGDSIRAHTNISRTEPDPALFQIPIGYQIIDESGAFTITITVPRQ